MMHYALIAAALFVGGVGASLVGLDFLGVALYPIPVLVYAARGFGWRAAGLIACAAAVAAVVPQTTQAVAYYALFAATGVPLGLGIARRWTYGWTVAAVTASVYAVVASSVVVGWDAWLAQGNAWYTAWIAEVQKQASASEEVMAAQVRVFTWMRDHWAAISVGLLLWPLLVEVCVVLSLASGWLQRRYGLPGVAGTFRTMRTSEWLVWAVIALAGLFYADSRWPEFGLKTPTWNTALALAAVYWMNGVSIMLHAFSALQWRPVLYVPLVVLLVWSGAAPMLCLAGLFDTWGDFRRVFDAIAAARKRMEESDDGP